MMTAIVYWKMEQNWNSQPIRSFIELRNGTIDQSIAGLVPILNNETAIEGTAVGLLQDANKNMEYSPF